MLIISDKGYNSTKHNDESENVVPSNHLHQPLSYVVGGWHIAPSVPRVSILLSRSLASGVGALGRFLWNKSHCSTPASFMEWR